ncbi:hypothetical protein JHK84_052189 [Glycine max]|nr:hypothetical protein JHK84_052189 [Glycine max]
MIVIIPENHYRSEGSSQLKIAQPYLPENAKPQQSIANLKKQIFPPFEYCWAYQVYNRK